MYFALSVEMLSIACSNIVANLELLLRVSRISSNTYALFQLYSEVLGYKWIFFFFAVELSFGREKPHSSVDVLYSRVTTSL